MSKINDLINMDIEEISLVIDPASPGADVILTKARDVSDEPRDAHGRWTTAVSAAREGAKVVAGHAKRIAVHAFNATKGSTVAVTSTRPSGAKPVEGGGVQFEFRHTLADGSRYVSSVQIRPEHVTPGGKVHQALERVHSVLRRAGVPAERPFGTAPANEKGFGGFLRLRRAPLTPEQQAEQAHQSALESIKTEARRRRELDTARGSMPGAVAPGAAQLFRSSQPAPAGPPGTAPSRPYTSPASSTGAGGIPTYEQPERMAQDWHDRVSAAGRPVGHGEIDEELAQRQNLRYPMPLMSSTAEKAGHWPYYTAHGDFVPGGRPDVQHHIEQVHLWRRQNPERAANVAQFNLKGDYRTLPRDTGGRGRAYFNTAGNYIPSGTMQDQGEWEKKYSQETDRLDYHKAMDANDEEDRINAVREPPISTPATRLFRDEGGHQITEDMVRRMPDDPALERARDGDGQRAAWGVVKSGHAQPLNFYSSPEVVRKPLAYAAGVTKSKMVTNTH